MGNKDEFFVSFSFLSYCVSFSNLLNEKIKCLFILEDKMSFVFGSNNCMTCESQYNCHGDKRGKEVVTLQLLWFLGATVLLMS